MKRLWTVIFIAALILFITVDLLRPHNEGHDGLAWSHIPGFFALFGFIAGVVIIVVARIVGRHWLQRKEDYYDRKDGDE